MKDEIITANELDWFMNGFLVGLLLGLLLVGFLLEWEVL